MCTILYSCPGNFYPRSPCGERQGYHWQNQRRNQKISIHALLAESDLSALAPEEDPTQFLSTLSLRRATLNPIKPRRFHYHFYPRSPCGERQQDKHRPNHERVFLSTLSLRRATSPPSITPAASRNFYPRSPCGERPSAKSIPEES